VDNVQVLWDMFLEEDVPGLAAAVTKSAEQLSLYEHVARVRTPSGKLKWLSATGNPTKHEDGSVIWDTLIIDVTEAKENKIRLEKTLDERDSLFRELHHRIKNNLNMVSSILYLKSTTTEDQKLNEFIRDTRARIDTIAGTHEQLLRLEEMDELYSKKYLEDLINRVVQSIVLDFKKWELQLDIADLILNVDTTLALGLIVNEIVTNIIKYAYPNEQAGLILVSLREKIV